MESCDQAWGIRRIRLTIRPRSRWIGFIGRWRLYMRFTLERSAIPVCQLCACCVGAFKELHEGVFRRRGDAHVVIAEDEFSQFWIVICGLGQYLFEVQARG